MQIKILQLNMWAGTHFSAIRDFLEQNDFDILCFQEVAGQNVRHGNVTSKQDTFLELTKVLGKTHTGKLTISQYAQSNPESGYFANALFYKKTFSLLFEEVLWLHKRTTPFPESAKTFEDIGRTALRVTLQNGKITFAVICTHLAWAPDKYEHPHQRQQNLKLITYIKNMAKPWILCGDFNIEPMQQSILDLEKFGKNLTKEFHIPNTIDPVYHVHWDRIRPGFPIDYIFVSPDVHVKDFKVLENEHLSDHLGLTAKIEI